MAQREHRGAESTERGDERQRQGAGKDRQRFVSRCCDDSLPVYVTRGQLIASTALAAGIAVLFAQGGKPEQHQNQTQNITISGDEKLGHELAEKA